MTSKPPHEAKGHMHAFHTHKWHPTGWLTGKAKGAKGGVTSSIIRFGFAFGIDAVVMMVPADKENPKDSRTKWQFFITHVDTSAVESTFDTAGEAMEACSAILAELTEKLVTELRTQSKQPFRSG